MITNFKLKLGEVIKEYRLKRNFKQSFMASQLGISQGQYGKIENGQVSITMDRLKDISDILNVSIINFILLSGYDESTDDKESLLTADMRDSGMILQQQKNEIDNLNENVSFLEKENIYLKEMISDKNELLQIYKTKALEISENREIQEKLADLLEIFLFTNSKLIRELLENPDLSEDFHLIRSKFLNFLQQFPGPHYEQI